MDDPKFEKTNHHYVPQHWQKRFRGDNGRLFAKTDSSVEQTSTAKNMSEDWVYTLFDELWRPSDALEDALSRMEGADAQLFDRLLVPGSPVSQSDRGELCDLIGMQVCRHPDAMRRGQSLQHSLAEVLASSRHYTKMDFTAELAAMGIEAREAENMHRILASIPEEQLLRELDIILGLSPQSIELPQQDTLRAYERVSLCVRDMELELVETPPAFSFVLSDNPVPQKKLSHGFTVPLSKSVALVARPGVAGQVSIHRRVATAEEVQAINREQAERCLLVIVGPSEQVLRSL